MWIFYAIFAQSLITVTNFIDKLMLNKYIRDSSIIVIFSASMAVLVSVVIFLIRGFPDFSFQQALLILLAGVATEFAIIPYFKALDADDPSRVVPLFQSIPVFTLLLSFFF